MYQFEYSLNDNDFWEFNKFHMQSATSLKKQINRMRLMIPMIFAILFFAFWARGNAETVVLLIIAAVYTIISIIMFFAIKPMVMRSTKRRIKFMKKQDKLPYPEHVIMKFEDDLFIEITKDQETKK